MFLASQKSLQKQGPVGPRSTAGRLDRLIEVLLQGIDVQEAKVVLPRQASQLPFLPVDQHLVWLCPVVQKTTVSPKNCWNPKELDLNLGVLKLMKFHFIRSLALIHGSMFGWNQRFQSFLKCPKPELVGIQLHHERFPNISTSSEKQNLWKKVRNSTKSRFPFRLLITQNFRTTQVCFGFVLVEDCSWLLYVIGNVNYKAQPLAANHYQNSTTMVMSGHLYQLWHPKHWHSFLSCIKNFHHLILLGRSLYKLSSNWDQIDICWTIQPPYNIPPYTIIILFPASHLPDRAPSSRSSPSIRPPTAGPSPRTPYPAAWDSPRRWWRNSTARRPHGTSNPRRAPQSPGPPRHPPGNRSETEGNFVWILKCRVDTTLNEPNVYPILHIVVYIYTIIPNINYV